MLLKDYRRMLDLLLIVGLFSLSNLLAFIFHFWLIPEFVMLASIVWLFLTVLAAWILIQQQTMPKFLEHLRRNWFFLPFLTFSGLSIIWSVSWEVSLYRWLILLCTIILGGYIGLRYDMREIIKLLSVFGIFILLLSSILIFFIPRIGVMNYFTIQGAWKGLYWHKNHMGLMTTFVNILFLINLIDSMPTKGRNVLFWGLLYIYSLFFIYQTDSVAAYLTTIFLHGVVLFALLLLKFRKKLRKTHYLIFVVVLLIASIVLSLNIDLFFGIFGRNTTLTGRIPMWTYVFDTYLDKQPLLGYGFNAFWYVGSHRVAIQQAAGYPDEIIIADNGFIDILMNTGYIGIILFLIFYLGVWSRCVQFAGKAKDMNEVFPVILMAYTLLANLTWSLLFENENFFMLNMISVLFCISSSSSINRGD